MKLDTNTIKCLRELGLKPEWDKYFDDRVHIKAEQLDDENKLHLFIEKQHDKNLVDYIHWHIKGTTPVFGEWNYTKKKNLAL
tara:strand:+ start:66 stop:311 length:246 start_codon:yes stop_codon:yes gene_type:complete